MPRTSRHRRVKTYSCLFLAFIVIGPGLLLLETPTEAATLPESVLRIGFLQKIDSLNPFIGITDAAKVFYGLVYDSLTCVDNDMNPAPNLALSSWAVPLGDPEMVTYDYPYGSVWQYNLTENAKWSDGTSFTADDAVWNINLNAQYFDYFWKYAPYAYFMANATKVDDTTIRIHFFDRPSGSPCSAAYGQSISILMIPKHKMLSMFAAEIGFTWTGVFDGEAMPIVGTGPFMATSTLYQDWLSGNPITLVRNPNYHSLADHGKRVWFDKIKLSFYDDVLAMSYALKNNQLDIAQFPPGPFFQLKRDVSGGELTKIAVYDGPKITNYWTEIGICQNTVGPNPSRIDPIIEHALAMATNKTYIVENFYYGLADVGSTMIPPIDSYWHYEPNQYERWSFDPSAAAALLESNGYIDIDSDGVREATATSPAVLDSLVANGTRLEYEIIVRSDYPEEKEIALWLDSQWAQIGIGLTLKVVDEDTMARIIYSYESWDMMIRSWSSDRDPNYQLYALSTMAINGWNDIYYSNPAYDENYTQSAVQMDNEVRKAYVDNCQRIMYLDSAYIIMAYPNQTYAWRTDTFSGWGDWANDPGRSLDNYWTANPLLFDLTYGSIYANPPSDLSMTSAPRARPLIEMTFEARAKHPDGYPLEFKIDFGDGNSSAKVTDGGTGWQNARFVHTYSDPGVYTVTITVRDGFSGSQHVINVTSTIVIAEGEPYSSTYAAIGAAVALLAGTAVVLVQVMRGRGKSLHDFHWR